MPHIMVKQTSLDHLKFWQLWAVGDKLISNSVVVGHRVVFLDQAKVRDVCYSLWFIP